MEYLKTLKTCGAILISQNDEDIVLFSRQTNSMERRLTETEEHNFEIHNNVALCLQSLSLIQVFMIRGIF